MVHARPYRTENKYINKFKSEILLIITPNMDEANAATVKVCFASEADGYNGAYMPN